MVLLDGVIAVRPAEVVALVYLHQLFRGILGVVLVLLLPQAERACPVAELVAPVLGRPELAVDRIQRDADRIANAAREVIRRAWRLIHFARVEFPNTRARVELDAGIRT